MSTAIILFTTNKNTLKPVNEKNIFRNIVWSIVKLECCNTK